MDKAKEQCRAALKLDSNLALTANNLAWLLQEEKGGNLDEALALARAAHEKMSDCRSFLQSMYFR
jgi:hypothetical protein